MDNAGVISSTPQQEFCNVIIRRVELAKVIRVP